MAVPDIVVRALRSTGRADHGARAQAVSTNSLRRDIINAALRQSRALSMTRPMHGAIPHGSSPSKHAMAHRSHSAAHE